MATSYYSTLDTRPPLEGALLLHLQRIITRYHSPLEIIASEPCQRIQRSWAFDDDVVIKNEDNPWIRQRKRIYLKNRAKNATSAWVPRPPNMFMIFKTVAFVPPADAQAIWRHMSDSEKAPWKEAATMMAAAHSKIFPHYKFCPRTKKETRSVSFRSVSFGSKGGVEKPHSPSTSSRQPLHPTSSECDGDDQQTHLRQSLSPHGPNSAEWPLLTDDSPGGSRDGNGVHQLEEWWTTDTPAQSRLGDNETYFLPWPTLPTGMMFAGSDDFLHALF